MSKHLSHTPSRKKLHTISLQAPVAKSVVVTGSFCGWSNDGHPLKHDGNGTWKATLTLNPGRHEYRFLVDGAWQDDPACSDRTPNPFGTENCILQV